MIPRPARSTAARRPLTSTRLARIGAVAVTAIVLLSGCSGTPTPTFSGDGAKYFTLVHERYEKCLGDYQAEAYAFNPGGIDPRQVGTVEVSDKKNQLYFAVVTPVKKGDALLTVPDSSTAGRLKSAGC